MVYECSKKRDRGGVRAGKAGKKGVGDDLRSQDVTVQVPSALAGLTAGFEMEPGVPPPLLTPTTASVPCACLPTPLPCHRSRLGLTTALRGQMGDSRRRMPSPSLGSGLRNSAVKLCRPTQRVITLTASGWHLERLDGVRRECNPPQPRPPPRDCPYSKPRPLVRLGYTPHSAYTCRLSSW